MKKAAEAAARVFSRVAAFLDAMREAGAPVAPAFRVAHPAPRVPGGGVLTVMGAHLLLRVGPHEIRGRRGEGGGELFLPAGAGEEELFEGIQAFEQLLEPALRAHELWAPTLAPVLGELEARAKKLEEGLRAMRSLPLKAELEGGGAVLEYDPALGGGIAFATPRVRVAVGPGVGDPGARLAGILPREGLAAVARGADLELFEKLEVQARPVGLVA